MKGLALPVKRNVRGITKRLQSCSRVYSRKRLIKNRYCRCRLRAVKDERRREPDRVLAGAEHQQAAVEARIDDLSRSVVARSFVTRSRTSSMPIINPRPRTSPMSWCFCCSSRSRSIMKAPTSAAFFINESFRSLIVASAAAHDTGLPPNVLACEPGGQSITSASRGGHAERQSGRDTLGDRHDVGLDAKMLDRKHLPGPAHARLHFVGNQQDAVLLRNLAQPLMKLRLRHDIAALALDRLDDHAGHFLRRDEVHEDLMLEKVEALRLAGLRLQADRTAIAIAVIARETCRACIGPKPRR